MTVVFVGACSGGPTAPEAVLDGSWEGFVEWSEFTVLYMTLDLIDRSGEVDGTGRIRSGATQIATLLVSGSRSGRVVDLTLDPSTGDGQMFDSIRLRGSVSGDSLDGRLDGSGFTEEPVVLERTSP